MTVRDLISNALRLIGAIGSGAVPSASEQADSLVVLNEMLDLWGNEGLLIPSYTRQVFKLEAGRESYSMGIAGLFATTRPLKIEAATWTQPNIITTEIVPADPGDPLADPVIPPTDAVYQTDYLATREYPIEIINIQKWSEISDKTMQGQPTKLYVEGLAPASILHFYPVPSQDAAVVLYSQKQLATYDLDDLIVLPPGYSKAMRFNLAVDLAPEFGKVIDAKVNQTAIESKALISRQNKEPSYMTSDAAGLAGGKSFNGYSGD